MVSVVRRWWLLAPIVLAALGLRIADLARRPMHADEANQAVKTGDLLESGRYAFDPRDHHGPTLYYFALPIAWARGQHTLAELDETTVRLVPALFGTLAVLLLAVFARPLGHWPAAAAALFFALSPPAVYYSRTFIQETLLLASTLAALVSVHCWWRQGRVRHAIAAGVAVGLMQATKASAPLFLVAAAVATLLARPGRPVSSRAVRDAAIAAGAALLTAALFYSSFGTHPAGLRDALAVYGPATTRLTRETGHEKPWWYYLSLFGWQRNGGLLWQQLAFSALALAGLGVTAVNGLHRWLHGRDADAALTAGDRLLRWAAVYTLIVALALSVIPYKTPWHAIHFVPGLALLAAGALAAISRLRTGALVAIAAAFLVAATLLQQTWRAAFWRPADERNPFAYVHAGPDVLQFRPLAVAALARSPQAPVRIIADEYWPLPWYLRGLPRVGYWNTPPADCDGALVIASGQNAERVRTRLRGAYRESFLGLRPGVLMVVFTPAAGP